MPPPHYKEYTMDLLLWRHAQAVDVNDSTDDLQRPLTKHGEAQATRMAAWLKRHLPAHTRILSSPALRTRQTVLHLAHAQYELCPQIAPGASLQDLLQAAQWPNSPTPVLIVGHQPTLGMAAQQLLHMQAPCAIKKGALWWLRHRVRDGQAQVVLVTIQHPQML